MSSVLFAAPGRRNYALLFPIGGNEPDNRGDPPLRAKDECKLIPVPAGSRQGEVDVRGAISRVLSSPQGGGRPFLWDLGRPRPRTIYPGGLNGAGRHRSSPIRSFSGWGLPCHFRRRKRGALLPHRFTLAARLREVGGLFSVALSLGLRPVGVTNHPDPWSPDFPPPADARRRHEERPLGLSHPPPA